MKSRKNLVFALFLVFTAVLSGTAFAQTSLSNGSPINGLSGAQGGQQFYKISVPAGASNLEVKISGGSGDCDLYVKRGATPTTSSYDFFLNMSGNNETIPISSPASGDWYIMLRGYFSYSGVSLVATYSGGGGTTATVTTLYNGSLLNGISASQGSQRFYKINVPSGQSTLEIKISGGSGDCDLYVKRGSQPTTASYDYRPYIGGNNETVTVSSPTSGDWFIMLQGYSAYSGVALSTNYSAPVMGSALTPTFSTPGGSYSGSVTVSISCATSGATIRYTTNGNDPTSSSSIYGGSLTFSSTTTLKARAFKNGMYESAVASATYTVTPVSTVTALTNNVAVSGISGAQGTQKFYKLYVPAGQSSVEIKISDGTGDCDLYVRRGSQPSTSTYDYRPYLAGNNETVTVTNPASGDWYVMLQGYSAYSGVTLRGAYGATNQTNVNDLAAVIMSEASIGYDIERKMVGWTVMNRMSRNNVTTVKSVWGAYAHSQAPTQAIIALAASLLNGTVSDSSGGATHFYSPISMPTENQPSPGTNYFLEQTTGLTKRNWAPNWSASYSRISVNEVREIYYKFYRQPGSGTVY